MNGWIKCVFLDKARNQNSWLMLQAEVLCSEQWLPLMLSQSLRATINHNNYYHFQGFAYMHSTLTTAASNVTQYTYGHGLNYLATNTIWIINTGSISIALPIVNHFLIPLKPTLNIRLKIGVGFLLHILSFGIAALIQWQQEHLYHYQFFYLMVIATLVLSIGETTVFVSSEFVMYVLETQINIVAY